MTPAEVIAKIAARARALPDVVLVALVTPGILERFDVSVVGEVDLVSGLVPSTLTVGPPRRRRKRKAASRPPRSRPAAKAKPKAKSKAAGATCHDAVYRFLIGQPAPVSRSDVAQALKISLNVARSALVALRRKGRAFQRGANMHSRWAATEELFSK